MYENKFTAWYKWENRHNIGKEHIQYPGIYICAITNNNIEGEVFSWLQEIEYIGMTNGKTGLKGRLKQFDNTIQNDKRIEHGGADRVKYVYQDYQELINKLYVSVAPFECNTTSPDINDLRTMGAVAQFEYECFACYKERFHYLPKFNNNKNNKSVEYAPKFSKKAD